MITKLGTKDNFSIFDAEDYTKPIQECVMLHYNRGMWTVTVGNDDKVATRNGAALGPAMRLLCPEFHAAVIRKWQSESAPKR